MLSPATFYLALLEFLHTLLPLHSLPSLYPNMCVGFLTYNVYMFDYVLPKNTKTPGKHTPAPPEKRRTARDREVKADLLEVLGLATQSVRSFHSQILKENSRE